MGAWRAAIFSRKGCLLLVKADWHISCSGRGRAKRILRPRGRSELNRNEFLNKVMQRVNIPSKEEAELAARSVLAALADELSPDKVNALASRLPPEFKDFLTGRAGLGGQIDMESFISRIQSDLDLETWDHAERLTRGVFAVLKEAVGPRGLEDVLEQLPEGLQHELVTA